MSADNDPPYGSPNPSYFDPSRRASAVSNRALGGDTVRSSRSHDSLSLKPFSDSRGQFWNRETDEITPEVILNESELVQDNPDQARIWLRSFGSLEQGTDVSTRLKNLQEENGELPTSQTLLSILAQWIPLWSNRAEKARKDHRTTRTSTLKEQIDLDWLLQYVHDYLHLGHDGFKPEEMQQLVTVVNEMCLRTNKQSDINHSINILDAVISLFRFPPECLEQTLIVLSACSANLQDQPEHLFDCFEGLACGDLADRVVEILFDLIQTPTTENNAKNLAFARGAVRLLRNAAEFKKGDKSYVLSLARFVEVLHEASQHGIFRFCVDLLKGCHTVFSIDSRKDELLSLDWKDLIDAIEICLTTSPPGYNVAAGSALSLSRTSSHDEEFERSIERHVRERDNTAKQIGNDLADIWTDLSPEQNKLVHNYCLSFPQYFSATQGLEVLSNTEQFGLCQPTSDEWRPYFDKLMINFVRNDNLLTVCRIKAIEILRDVVISVLSESDNEKLNEKQANLDVGTVIESFLSQAAVEGDRDVCQSILSALQQLATSKTKSSTGNDYSSMIVENFNTLVMYQNENNDLADQHALLAAKALGDVFIKSIHTNSKLTISAYEGLLDAASLHCKSRRSRIHAKRVLCRIRADSGGFVFIQRDSESEYIADALCRTRNSAEAFNYDVPPLQRHSGSSTSLSSKSVHSEPLWMYPESDDFKDIDEISSPYINVNPDVASQNPDIEHLDITSWLLHVMRCLQSDMDWETYSFTLVHLGSQLSNVELFSSSLHTVVMLRQIMCEQVGNSSFREPPVPTGLKKSDVALCMFNALTSLIPYATMKHEAIQKGFGDNLIRVFLMGIGEAWEGTSRSCIHALSICTLEIPSSVASLYPSIVDKMSKMMTQPHLTMHILEFLTQVARLIGTHSNFSQEEILTVFGVCIRFLEKSREQNEVVISSPSRVGLGTRHSGINLRRTPYRAAMLTDHALPQYASALGYYTMIFWFLSLRLSIRSHYVPWIVRRLIWKNSRGEEMIDEQSQVFVDMMQRVAFSDLGETAPNHQFASPEDGEISSASWIVGLSVISIETAVQTGKTQITKRQASGTTYAMYQQLTTQIPSHHTPIHTEERPESVNADVTEILPQHVLLQMVSSAAPTSISDQPILLPKEDWVTRALEIFDRVPTVDSHKIGVLYIDEGQTREADFLANTGGPENYISFINGLGYEVSLKPPIRFNPQGLTYPLDGETTIAWRDRISEIVFHIPTMMPTDLEEDPQCVTKKSHVGNCHVNIVFNNSGIPWDFENFKSQLNYVNVVITPTSQISKSTVDVDHTDATSDTEKKPAFDGKYMPEFYKVQVITKPNFPSISPAVDPKVISATQLPFFVRHVALNANIFSQVWNTKDHDSEFPSNWRSRLQQIKMLKERMYVRISKQDASGSGLLSSPSIGAISSAAGRRTPIREDLSQTRNDTGMATQLDFGKWTV